MITRTSLTPVLSALIIALVASVGNLHADVPPPHISQFQPHSDGSVLLTWDATPESAYRVLTTTNLSDGSWIPVDYLVAASNSVTWQANGQSGVVRFYKLVTDANQIQSVEPSVISTGAVTQIYIIGQGFGSNDTLRLVGPGVLTLTNRIIIKSTLMSVTVGPGFTPDVPGTYQFQVISGTTGQTTTLPYYWTVVSQPAPSQALLEPPQDPPASPECFSMNYTKIEFGPPRRRGESSERAAHKEFKGHVTLMKLTDDEAEAGRRLPVHNLGSSGQDGVSSERRLPSHNLGSSGQDGVSARKDFTGHVTLMKLTDDEADASRRLPLHNLGSSGQDGVSIDARMIGDECDDGDPAIHPFSGEVQLQTVDMFIPGRGLDFIWARTYRSRTTARQGMTYSWTCSYDVSVSQTSDGITVFDGTGRSDVYSLGSNGVYSCSGFFNEGQLTKGVFTLTFPDTGRWVFNPMDSSATAGKLAQIVDRNGNTMSLSYDTSGRLSQIVDDLGRTNTMAYNSSGQLSTVTDFSGRTVTYQYYIGGKPGGSAGDLQSVTSPPVIGTPNGNDFPKGKTTTYTYSSGFTNDAENHLLLYVTDPKGQIAHQFTYQHNPAAFEFLRCISDQYGTNDPTYLTYVPQVASPSNHYATLKVIVRDCFGNVREPSYDSRNRLVDLREYTGRAPSPGPVTDVSNRPVGKLRVDDPDYYETQWSWNNDSLCVKKIEPGGNAMLCVYGSDFDKNAGPRKKGDLQVCRELPCCADINRDGFPDLVSRYQYDPRFGSPARDYCVQYRESDFAFANTGSGKYGRVKVQFHWDRSGKGDDDFKAVYVNPMSIVRQQFFVNESSRLLPTVSQHAINTKGAGTNGRLALASQQPKIIDNQKGLLISFCTSATDPRGNTTTCAYDAHGNCVHEADADVPVPVITWEPRVFDFAYNTFGQLTAITNAADANGRRRVDVANYYTSGPQAGYLSDWTVDTQGPTLIRSSYEYDPRGNLTRCIDPRTNDWLYTYNALDQLVQASSASLSLCFCRIEFKYSYDAADNLIERDVENRDYTGTLDATNPLWTTVYHYDTLNRCVRMEQARDVAHTVATEYQYDANDNLVLCRSGEAVNGDDTNKVTQFTYDERDLLYQSTDAPGTGQASPIQWSYDANGQPATKQYVDTGLSARVSYAYDGFSRLITVTDAMGNIVSNRYDANGNVIQSTLLGETNDVPGSAGNRVLAQTAYQYDPLDRCVSAQESYFDAAGAPVGKGASTTTYAYAPNGDCLSVTDDNGHTTHYAYDTVGRLATVTDPKTNSVSLAYDANGNVLSVTETDKSDLGGANQLFITTAQYDSLDRCVSSSDNVGNTTQYAYDSRDNLVRQIDPNGNLTGWSYDGLGRCTLSIADLNGDGLLDFAVDAGHASTYDDNNCLLVSTDANTNSTSYTYDALDRPILQTFADGTHCTFVWDSRSELVSSTDPNGSVVTNRYDLLHRIVHRDIAARSGVATTTTFETFAYDGCSRLTLASNDVSRLEYAYDSLDDCIASKQDGLLTTYTYDGVGNCLAMTYPSGRGVQYTYDALDNVKTINTTRCEGCGNPWLGDFATFSYDGPDRLSRVTRANGVNTRINYDGLAGVPNATGDLGSQQVARINHATAGGSPVIDQRSFAYDHNQNKTQRAQLVAFAQGQDTLTNSWSYNALDMMDHAINCKGQGAGGCITIDYDLDAMGNRIAVTNNGTVALYTRNATIPPGDFEMDRYTTTPFASQQYDQNGNLVQVTSSVGQLSYVYDYADRLAEVIDFSTGLAVPVASFTYDALGRRISKTSYPPSPSIPVTTYYVHGGGETDKDCGGTTIEERAGGPGGAVTTCLCNHLRTAMAAFNGAGALQYYFHGDDLGNVLALTDASGNVLEHYEYDDYGAPSFLTSNGVPTTATSSAFGNPFLFHGMEWDAETALYWGGGGGEELPKESYYDCRTGRYLLRAGVPLTFGQSAYAFADNNPWTTGESCNVIKGCWIGLDASGRSSVGNGSAGVFLSKGATSRRVTVNGSGAGSSNGMAFKEKKPDTIKKEFVGHVTLIK